MTADEEYKERIERSMDAIEARTLAYLSVRDRPNLFDALIEEERGSW